MKQKKTPPPGINDVSSATLETVFVQIPVSKLFEYSTLLLMLSSAPAVPEDIQKKARNHAQELKACLAETLFNLDQGGKP